MKNYVLSLCCLFIFGTMNAQVTTPPASPLCKVEQRVGLTDVTLQYSRPGVKDRKIFGEMLSFDTKWRTGANGATLIGFSTDVTFGGVDVPAGKYAILSTPGASSWEVYLYDDTSLRGVPSDWDDEKVVAKVMVNPKSIPMTFETMLIDINNLRNNSADFNLMWENTMISIPMGFPADEMVNASIDKTMAGPSAGDYYNAARYYRESGKDLNKALEWMNKSLEMNGERFWTLRQKALLLADMGNYKDAIMTAKKSLEMATEAGNSDYIKSNNKSIAEWMKK